MNINQALAGSFTGQIATDDATRTVYARDASIFSLQPQAVAYPKNAEEVGQLVRFATQHMGDHVSLTVRAGGTDMTGGPLTNSLVLDMQRDFNHIITVDAHRAVVQPGVFYRDFEAATLQQGGLLPCYPASRELCTVGGMVANNAGGEKSLVYGKTEKYVEQLKVVLADGNEYTIASLEGDALQQKLQLHTFEGELYRKMYNLVTTHHELLQAARPKVSKNSAGYNLWNIWNGRTFDLTQLFTGSQGTLGIITEITFRLVQPKPVSRMLIVFLEDLQPLAEVITTVLKYQPESFESYDDKSLRLALRFLPSLLRKVPPVSLASFAIHLLPELKFIVRRGLPQLVLIAEFTGFDTAEVTLRAQAAAAAVKTLRQPTKLLRTAAEAAVYWAIRRESFNLLRHHVKDKHTVPFIDDVCVAPNVLPKFLPELSQILNEYHLEYSVAGHVGDGNFHIIPLMDLKDPAVHTVIDEVGLKVYELVLKYKGSISGEHNDGLIRSHYLPKMYGRAVYELFEQTKYLFDPHTIFNPGKKINSTWADAATHIDLAY